MNHSRPLHVFLVVCVIIPMVSCGREVERKVDQELDQTPEPKSTPWVLEDHMMCENLLGGRRAVPPDAGLSGKEDNGGEYPKIMSKNDIVPAMEGLKERLRQCSDESSKATDFSMKIKILPSGEVEYAGVKGEQGKTKEVECAARIICQEKFKKMQSTFSFSYPMGGLIFNEEARFLELINTIPQEEDQDVQLSKLYRAHSILQRQPISANSNELYSKLLSSAWYLGRLDFVAVCLEEVATTLPRALRHSVGYGQVQNICANSKEHEGERELAMINFILGKIDKTRSKYYCNENSILGWVDDCKERVKGVDGSEEELMSVVYNSLEDLVKREEAIEFCRSELGQNAEDETMMKDCEALFFRLREATESRWEKDQEKSARLIKIKEDIPNADMKRMHAWIDARIALAKGKENVEDKYICRGDIEKMADEGAAMIHRAWARGKRPKSVGRVDEVDEVDGAWVSW